MTKRCRCRAHVLEDGDQSLYNDLEDVFPRWYIPVSYSDGVPLSLDSLPLLHQCGSRFRFPIAKNPFVSERGHHRICSNRTLRAQA